MELSVGVCSVSDLSPIESATSHQKF